MGTSAKLLSARISAQKCRLVVDQIRGLPVGSARNLLVFSQKKAAGIVKKLLDSAIANAEHNDGADIDNLVVSKICVDEGPSVKRLSPRAKGRANRVTKRSCHIALEVFKRTL